MKFNDKFPEATDALKLNTTKLLGPHPEVEVAPGIRQSWRVYPCSNCRKPNSWRVDFDDMELNVCSDECFVAIGGQAAVEKLAATVEKLPAMVQREIGGVMTIVPVTDEDIQAGLERVQGVAEQLDGTEPAVTIDSIANAFLDAGQRAAEEAAKQHQELVREEEKNVTWEGDGVDTPNPS